MTVYVCEICHAVNRAELIRCQVCGTTPASYSEIGKASSYRVTDFGLVCRAVVTARGCSRTEDRRGRKVYFRTVPLDYFV